MPLDARKTLHILQVLNRSFSGRQRTIVLVKRSGNSYSYTAVQGILRSLQAPDPQDFSSSGTPLPQTADSILIVPLGTNLGGAVYVADTSTPNASAAASAVKYEIVEILPVGIVPGGSHLRVALRRLR